MHNCSVMIECESAGGPDVGDNGEILAGEMKNGLNWKNSLTPAV